jgi:hypothetical protein
MQKVPPKLWYLSTKLQGVISHKKMVLTFSVVGIKSLEWEGTDHPWASLVSVRWQNSKQRRHAAQNRIVLFMCHDAVTSARAMNSVHRHDPFPNPNSRKPIAIVTDVTTLPTTAFPFSLGALRRWRKQSLNCRQTCFLHTLYSKRRRPLDFDINVPLIYTYIIEVIKIHLQLM